MITIEECLSQKLPTRTSLYFKLSSYNQSLFDLLVQTQDSDYNSKTGIFEFPINRLYFLINLLSKYDLVEFKPYKEKSNELIDISGIKFKPKLYKHQLEGVEYGVNHNGWLLLDDQGLGKTLQVICLAEALYKKENLKHCLIICGVNGLKWNWAEEIAKFSKLDYKILGQTITKTGKVRIKSVAERCKELKAGIKEFFVITNIETLQHKEFYNAFQKSKSTFDMIVLDEAHKCKNPSSKSAKTLLKLKSKRNIALSGTIIVNDPENAYVPLKWTGNTQSTYSKFKSLYNVYGGFGGVQVIGYKNLELLNELILSCSLRRLKSQVLDLPPKIYKTEYVDLKDSQRKLYNEVAVGIAEQLDKLGRKPTIIEEITINMRLRQITAFPGMLSTEITQSAKLERLYDLVDEIIAQGDKVVIFSTFKGTADEVYSNLLKYNPVLCTGSQSDLETSIRKKQFQEDNNTKVFVGTWQKCGTGFTLTAASYLIFIDTPWTDSDFQQASDRIYRIGQTKPVTIITLIAKDTYDERVQEIISRKECLSGYLVDNKNIDKDILKIFDE